MRRSDQQERRADGRDRDAIGTVIRFVVLPGPSYDRVAIPMLLDPMTL
ncbi:MAG: hypothetical protein OXC68_11935 [Aestuariivita sp.]|nr:hypothetical protein [Aestuariivita sp.]